MDPNQKLENSLNIAVEMNPEELEESENLQVGFDEEDRTWKLIVQYHGDIRRIETLFEGARVSELFHQFAIVTIPERYLEALAALPEVEYIEKPKSLYFNVDVGRSVSCVNSIQGRVSEEWNGTGDAVSEAGENHGLTGRGVLIGIVDSGIDYSHPDFIFSDGTTRIRYLWDQTARGEDSLGRIPAGYSEGAEYNAQEINEALQLPRGERAAIVPVTDTGSGHGTAVAGIAAGNGAASVARRYRGIAVESELIVVKLGTAGGGFPRTTEVMEGLDYVVRKALELQMPVALNLSFGNNSGPHDGQSLFENYITQLSGVWKSAIIVASGNEGDARHHARADLKEGAARIPFAVGEREKGLIVQIWKRYVDEIELEIETPSGKKIEILEIPGNSTEYLLPQAGDVADGINRLLVYFGEPSPYTMTQEIYLEWLTGDGNYVEAGTWHLTIQPVEVRYGIIELWMPTTEAIGLSTGFLNPSPDTTLTIPATAYRTVAVGAYRAANDSMAPFSGRGTTADGRMKPDLVAPGVDVMTAAPGGGYSAKTGTSMAAPFVTGSAALLMEWGIVRGNDPYLYGEKVRAYLIKGARPLPGESVPSVRQGWGALCVADSLPG